MNGTPSLDYEYDWLARSPVRERNRKRVVKASLVFSREEVLWRGLDLNLGDGERKVDFLGEVLDLAAQRYL